MSTSQLAKKIEEWENKYSESFSDYFMHDNINDFSWSNFLKEKGHTEKANEIEDEHKLSDGKIMDQEFLYNVYPEYSGNKFMDENKKKNVLLWSEFIANNPEYLEKAVEFFKNK